MKPFDHRVTRREASRAVAGGCLLLIRPALHAETTAGLPNAFYALDTGTIDDNHQSAEAQVEMLKELGYPGIGYCRELAGVPEMLRQLDKHGLRMFALYVPVKLDSDSEPYDPRLEETLRLLQGRDTFIWLSFQSQKHKPSAPEGDPRAVEIIRRVADMARPAGLRVALYPHHKFWLERVEDALRLTKKSGRENVGVTFNLCHWRAVDSEANLKPLMKQASPHLMMVTINGSEREITGLDTWIETLDRGSYDVSKFLRALMEVGYGGPIGLQGYGIKGDVRDNLERSMAAWRELSSRLAR